MNSALYTAKVMHSRLAPKKHSFWYRVYLLYLDLDEIEGLSKKFWCLGYNRFNLFSFRDKDHLQLGGERLQGKGTREHLSAYLFSKGIILDKGKVMLLTNLSVLGYNFNPVSFYFCFDELGFPLCTVAEISNTFREMKLFFIGKEELEEDRFRQRAQKFFYVSPFTELDTYFDFNLAIPSEKLDLKIDDYDGQGKRFFLSTLKGKRKELKASALMRYFFLIPLIPLRVMWLIHWQAFLLWRKKIRFHAKDVNRDLQKNVYRPYKAKSRP